MLFVLRFLGAESEGHVAVAFNRVTHPVSHDTNRRGHQRMRYFERIDRQVAAERKGVSERLMVRVWPRQSQSPRCPPPSPRRTHRRR